MGSVDDIEAVYALNQKLFSEAWSKQSLVGVMLDGFSLYVCEYKAELVGYILSQDILDEVHIMQLAVLTGFQRQGIARQLSKNLLSSKTYASVAMLEVRDSNVAALCLYAQLGFSEQGRRKGYYSPKNKLDQREDAVLMQCQLAC
ncbi:MAG: ribosomal protein S18-alanine N-acetyltransferase [Mariprofundaceae bacterium]